MSYNLGYNHYRFRVKTLITIYINLLRPLLFMLSAEHAQKIAERLLRIWPIWSKSRSFFEFERPSLRTRWSDMYLENPIGLAAGFDKNCRLLTSLECLGFGYLIAGTVTLKPGQGNVKPRMFRDKSAGSLINAMGFPSNGLDEAHYELLRTGKKIGKTPILVSIAGTCIEDIITCYKKLGPLVSSIEINISSPNTEGLRIFHQPETLRDLLSSVNDHKMNPIHVKLPPYRPDDLTLKKQIISLSRVCSDLDVDGLTISNTMPISDSRLGIGKGGLSGRPVYSNMLDMVKDIRIAVGENIEINACGGIFTGEHALEAMRAGANTIQLYTGLVYRGPAIVKDIKSYIAQFG